MWALVSYRPYYANLSSNCWQWQNDPAILPQNLLVEVDVVVRNLYVLFSVFYELLHDIIIMMMETYILYDGDSVLDNQQTLKLHYGWIEI